jgi:hypothetical protein
MDSAGLHLRLAHGKIGKLEHRTTKILAFSLVPFLVVALAFGSYLSVALVFVEHSGRPHAVRCLFEKHWHGGYYVHVLARLRSYPLMLFCSACPQARGGMENDAQTFFAHELDSYLYDTQPVAVRCA